MKWASLAVIFVLGCATANTVEVKQLWTDAGSAWVVVAATRDGDGPGGRNRHEESLYRCEVGPDRKPVCVEATWKPGSGLPDSLK